MRAEVSKIKSERKNFEDRLCAHCQEELTLPTVHFMCGHTYHKRCVEVTNSKMKCTMPHRKGK